MPYTRLRASKKRIKLVGDLYSKCQLIIYVKTMYSFDFYSVYSVEVGGQIKNATPIE